MQAMPFNKDRERDAREASQNVTLMLTELSRVHFRLLACFTKDETIEKWDMEITEIMERIFQAIKEPE